MADMPMFSIIIPVYNREKHICSAVKSILSQSTSCWELLLIDDGSTDKTYEICQRYAKEDIRIHCLHKENGGVSSARNLGIAKASGKYVLFLDSDDMIREDALSVLQTYISTNTEVDLICFGTRSLANRWIAQHGNTVKQIGEIEIRAKYLPAHINIYPQDRNFVLNYVWNKCYRMDFLKNHDLLFDENRRTWEDGIFVVNCLDQAKLMLTIPESLHCGCAASDVEHLSSKVFRTQLSTYVSDEAEFKRRFEKEYDFSGEHYCRANLRVMNMLFSRMVITYGSAAKETIRYALNESIVTLWAEHITPQDKNEEILRDAILSKNEEMIYQLYHCSLMTRMIRKIRRMLKKQ